MKLAPRDLLSLLNNNRHFWTADLYRFELQSGERLLLTSHDLGVRLRYRDLVVAAHPQAYWTMSVPFFAQDMPSEIPGGPDGEWNGTVPSSTLLTADLDPAYYGVETPRSTLVQGQFFRFKGVARHPAAELGRSYTYEWLFNGNHAPSGDQFLIDNDSYFRAYWSKTGANAFRAGHTSADGEHLVQAVLSPFTKYHIAVRYNERDLELVVDGVVRDRQTNVPPPRVPDGTDGGFAVGSKNTLTTGWTLGHWAHLALYNYALSDTELKAHAAASFGLMCRPGIPIERTMVRSTRGMEVDQVLLTLYPREDDTLGEFDTPFWVAARNRAFDNASVTVFRAYSSAPPRYPKQSSASSMELPSDSVLDMSLPPGFVWPVGSVSLFSGRVVQGVGKVGALQLNIQPTTRYLDVKMPRYRYMPGCRWELFGPGCGLREELNRFYTRIKQGSNRTHIEMADAPPGRDGRYALGQFVALNGPNAYIRRHIKSQHGGVLELGQPLPYEPRAEQDEFYILPGCDKRLVTCDEEFDNRLNFGGYPFIPPPETIVGLPVEENAEEDER